MQSVFPTFRHNFLCLPFIITCREGELRNRARQLHKLAFGLYAGEVDQHAGSLPYILERIADAIKLTHDFPLVHRRV